jgi:ribonucleoside-triphosphate reductase
MNNLPSTYQDIIHLTKYARYLDDKGRRETWGETVDRLIDYLSYKITDCPISMAPFKNPEEGEIWEELRQAILNLEVMPSMRLMMSAGEACERDNIAAYNCAYMAINNKRAFSEALYILMNGTGVGFSCERQEVSQLPIIPSEFNLSGDTIVIADSKRGWAVAFKKLLSSLWEGDIPQFDFSRVRPAGARLKTFGGRASGPQPLLNLFLFTIETFKKAVGRKLNSIEVHDIMCMVGDIVVVGGVRRSALISLSNLTDRRMREAKIGEWWRENPQRRLANNSVCYTEKPDVETFMEEWLSLVKSKSGERGIFNRVAAQNQASKWGRRSADINYGCNPCSEILLRDKQFCNLTEVVVREEDSYESLERKVRLATILGTIQSTLTNFSFLSEEWKKNTEEEHLLGVSLTGIMDNPRLNGTYNYQTNDGDYNVSFEEEEANEEFTGFNYYTLSEGLEKLRDYAREVNKEWAEKLGIQSSTAITCIKPSGTVSQLVDSASGIHPRHAPYYIRRIRLDKKDPIYQFLINNGFPTEDDSQAKDSTGIVSFPMKSPENSVFRKDRSAIEQLELWLIYQRYWCEHKPSATIYVKQEEWPEVGAWVWDKFDEISGVSFLPFSEHTYVQAPYEDITKEQYDVMLAAMPINLDWTKLLEKTDNTEGSQTLACVGPDGCEI